METQYITIITIMFLFFVGLIMYIHRQGVKKDFVIKNLKEQILLHEKMMINKDRMISNLNRLIEIKEGE